MNRRTFLALAGAPAYTLHAQTRSEQLLAVAESVKPALRTATVAPVSLVKPVEDRTAFLRWRMDKEAPAANLSDRLMKRGDSVIVDFGRHLTGHFGFSLRGEGRGVDAPARIKVTLGEVPAEVSQPLDPYKGFLSRAWLQDEVVNIDVLPAEIRLPRRYAFRYVKLEVVDTSPNFQVRFSGLSATAVTSATAEPPPLPLSVPEALRRIDAVSIATLRDCMQTVFEDGPKRDRRLWIGDLRLQALTNYVTFRDLGLVKRCLYLFAGLPREDGMVSACVFEDPRRCAGTNTSSTTRPSIP